jgi:hypothetical protein
VVDDVGVDPEHHADEFRGQDLLRVALGDHLALPQSEEAMPVLARRAVDR